MSKAEIMNKGTRFISKANLKLRKHSPELLIIFGTVGVVTSAVMACKATLKVHEVVDTAKNDIEEIHEAVELGVTKAGEKYTAEDSKKDLTLVYVQTGVKFVKLYGPSVALGVLSMGCMIKSNDILRKRYIATAAAYTAVDKGFKEYRGRVVERFGEELDRELKYNIKAKEIEETVVDENGGETTITRTVHVAEPSEYAKFFDEWCTGWVKNAELNLKFLKDQQNWANDKLQRQGYLFLNDVYDGLGIPRTKAGQIVGWMWDKEYKDVVDFGIYDLYNAQKRDFVNGYERSILLDFNVRGNILDLI